MEKWERVVLITTSIFLIVFILLEVCGMSFLSKYAIAISIIISVLTGVVSAIILLLLQKKHYQRDLFKYYSNIAGSYTRVDIGQDGQSDSDIPSFKERNVGLMIVIEYQGLNICKVTSEMWKDSNSLVECFVEFNENHRQTGSGIYKYIQGEPYTSQGHIGSWKVYNLNEGELLVQYQHIFPREREFNPEMNKGWERWVKNKDELRSTT